MCTKICTHTYVYVTCLNVNTHTHTHTHILFLILSSIMFYPKRLDIVPCALQQDFIAYPF